MRQTVHRHAVSAERLDEPHELAGRARHERAFEAGKPHAVEQTCRDAHDVFRRRADLVAHDVLAVIKADKLARKAVHNALCDFILIGVDEHAVGMSRQKSCTWPALTQTATSKSPSSSRKISLRRLPVAFSSPFMHSTNVLPQSGAPQATMLLQSDRSPCALTEIST